MRVLAIKVMAIVLAGYLASSATAQPRFTWEENGHEYFVSDIEMVWQDAVSYAESQGGHLVTLNSAAEQQWIVSTVLQYADAVSYTGCCLFVWIGFTDETVEGNWVWITGEPVAYTGWLPGEPNNANVSPTGEDYAALGTLSPGTPNGWGWYDYPSPMYLAGINNKYAIVEIEPPCVPDVNHDGVLNAGDFTYWLFAYNAEEAECDQNDDGLCTPADFTAWIANFNAGC